MEISQQHFFFHIANVIKMFIQNSAHFIHTMTLNIEQIDTMLVLTVLRIAQSASDPLSQFEYKLRRK